MIISMYNDMWCEVKRTEQGRNKKIEKQDFNFNHI